MLQHDHTFTTRAAVLADRADAMHQRRQHLGHVVEGLLQGWRGEAADAFTAAWIEWRETADSIIAGLAGSADRLLAHHDDVEGTDAGAAQAVRDLAGRLG